MDIVLSKNGVKSAVFKISDVQKELVILILNLKNDKEFD